MEANEESNSSEISAVSNSYFDFISSGSCIETLSYQTKNDSKDNEMISKNITVYLSLDYDKDDTETKCDILYLQHGAYGNENTWLGNESNPTVLKSLLDHMIINGDIKPLIVVTPYINPGDDWYDSACPAFFEELENDIMPFIEEHYHTYAKNTDSESFKESREHRAFAVYQQVYFIFHKT